MKVTISTIILILTIQSINGFQLTSDMILQWKNSITEWTNSTASYNGASSYTLELTNKGISSIHPDAFKPFADKVTHINLNLNKLTSITPEPFVGLNKLQHLNLYSNQITTFQLPYLPNLEFLFLDYNQISKIDYKISTLFPKMGFFNIGNNPISSIQPDAFHDATNLKIITLYNTGMTTLDTNLFQRLPLLERILLGQNKITAISTEFKLLPSLAYLDLSYNLISSIIPTAFIGLPSMTRIWLQNNKLTSLSRNTFTFNKQLSLISLSNNLLSSVHPDLFNGLTVLRQLYLSYNQIASLDCSVFRSNIDLKYLELNNNKLSYICSSLFTNTKLIESIYLNSNAIDSIDAETFTGLNKLYFINLRLNPFDGPVDIAGITKATGAASLNVGI